MSPACREVRGRFAAYPDETLTPLERGAVREHLALCGPCREEAASTDATLLFAAGGPPAEVSAADVARILQGVRSGVAIKQAERRLAKPPRRAAVVAAAAAVALFTLALPGGPSLSSSRAPSHRLGVPAASAPAGKVVPSGLAKAAAPPDGTGATVYEIAPGAGPNEPRVVWIVDHSLDI
jgi:hypothetical protein